MKPQLVDYESLVSGMQLKNMSRPFLARVFTKITLLWISGKVLLEARSSRRSPENGLARIWADLDQSTAFKKISAYCRHPYQLSRGDFVFLRLVRKLNKLGLYPSLPYRWNDEMKIGELAAGNQGAMVLYVHAGFAFAIKTFSDRARRVTIVAADPADVIRDVFPRTGVDVANVNILDRNSAALLHLRRSLMNGEVVCMAVDYRKEGCDTFNAISPAMFRLSSALGTPLYYTCATVNAYGIAECSIEGPVEGSTDEKIGQFLRFMKAHNPDAMYAVERYP